MDKVSYSVIGAAIEVHKQLGPGLLESVYHKCLFQEMRARNIYFNSHLSAPVEYRGIRTETELRCDFLVENCLVVEIKSVDALAPIYDAQLLTYMRLLNAPKGLLINFNCLNLFHEGQKTLVNELYSELS